MGSLFPLAVTSVINNLAALLPISMAAKIKTLKRFNVYSLKGDTQTNLRINK